MGSLDPAGPFARSIADLWWLMLTLGTGVYLVFAYHLARGVFRARGRSPEPTPPDASHPWIVRYGVVMTVVILLVVFVATLITMRQLPTEAPPDALEVEVVGHQFWWEVRYPDVGIRLRNEMRIPVGRPVEVRLWSADVIHSFWVPKLAGKMDALPDHPNTLVLQADEPGQHLSMCAEFCGLRHAEMIMTVIAEPEDRFSSWLASQGTTEGAG